MNVTPPAFRNGRCLAALTLTVLGGLVLRGRADTTDNKPLTAEQVRALQSQVQAERAAAEEAGLTRRFSPQWFRQADHLTKKGAEALTAGRLLAAQEALREARWQIPVLPAEFPPHVARVYGNLKMRHADWIQGLAYSPDGTRLATASKDGTVKIWDVATGKELRTFGDHTKPVNTVAYSPDGRTVASAGNDREVKLWDP